jgi:hypothetical protein
VTELQFLIHLLLEHKLGSVTRKLVAERIGEVEMKMNYAPVAFAPPAGKVFIPIPAPSFQCASTQAILDKNPDLTNVISSAEPVTVVAQTPATAAALNQRNQSIAIATSGKPEAGRTSPRKF